MKFPLSWLKDHLDTQADAAPIAATLTRIGLEVAGGDDARMNHAATKHLHPAFAAADHAPAFFHRPADIDLGRRFGEGEIAGAHTEHDIVALKEGL